MAVGKERKREGKQVLKKDITDLDAMEDADTAHSELVAARSRCPAGTLADPKTAQTAEDRGKTRQ